MLHEGWTDYPEGFKKTWRSLYCWSNTNACSVAEFELLCHEIRYKTILLNHETINNPLNHTECHLRHILSGTRRLIINQNAEKLFSFVSERQNPYSVTAVNPVPLHHLLTKEAVDRQRTGRLLKCFENGEAVYKSYRQDAFVEKKRKISALIPTSKLFS